VDFRGIFHPDKADSMCNAASLQVEFNAVRAKKIRKAAVHDECQQSLVHPVPEKPPRHSQGDQADVGHGPVLIPP
jgi:hypothetical protein